jgi:hypothetical protein
MAILPKKSDTPVATDDDHHDIMAADPTISQFPQGSSYGSPSLSSGNTAVSQSAMLQSSGGAMQEGAQVLITADDVFGNWINKRWRPLFSIMYLAACTCDFVLFPILWSVLQTLSKGQVTSQWMPLTIQGGGLFHIACGAVLGVAAYGRTQEKLAGKS